MHVCPGHDVQIGAPAGGAQVPDRGAPTASIARRELEVARAFLLRSVDVVVARDTDLLRAGDERIAHVAPHPHVADRERTAGTVPLVRPSLLVLGLDEVGQHVVERPACVPELTPVIEVLRLAADVEQSVDRAGAAEDLPARPVEAAPVERRLRFGLVAPIRGRIVHGLEVADWYVDPGIGILAAGLEQQDAGRRVVAQAGRQHAARRTGAHDDVVIVHHGLPQNSVRDRPESRDSSLHRRSGPPGGAQCSQWSGSASPQGRRMRRLCSSICKAG